MNGSFLLLLCVLYTDHSSAFVVKALKSLTEETTDALSSSFSELTGGLMGGNKYDKNLFYVTPETADEGQSRERYDDPTKDALLDEFFNASQSSAPSEKQTSPLVPQKRLKNRLADLDKQLVALKTSRRRPAPTRKRLWQDAPQITVPGGALRTWSFQSPRVEHVQLLLQTDGRPLECLVELWNGPDNTPQKLGVYLEDASVRPFTAAIATPSGPNTVAIRNVAQLEFPFTSQVVADTTLYAPFDSSFSDAMTIQGGALRSYLCNPSVESVQVLLKTDGRPLNARIELLQGPDNVKQVIEVYTENGIERPLYSVIETPGSSNVLRVINNGNLEFPMLCSVEPYVVGKAGGDSDFVQGGGDMNEFWSRRA